jgi:ankyrin repeat protein
VAGNSPLHVAVQCNNAAVAQLLFIDGKQMAAALNSAGMPPLHLATVADCAAAAAVVLMGAPAVAGLTCGVSQCTALHEACRQNALELAKLLLVAGCPVNQATLQGGWTALHYAAGRDSADLVRLLLLWHADAECEGGGTPLLLAAQNNATQVAEAICAACPTALHAVSAAGLHAAHVAAAADALDITWLPSDRCSTTLHLSLPFFLSAP